MSRLNTVLSIAVLFALGLVGAQVVRHTRAVQDARGAERALSLIRSDAAELRRLRAASEARLFGEPPAEDFIDRVNRVLVSLGLPASTATAITRETDRAVSTPGGPSSQRRRDMRIELRPVSPPDLGRFLAAWNDENPAWTVRQVSLRKINDRRASPNEYHAALTCSAEYTTTGSAP